MSKHHRAVKAYIHTHRDGSHTILTVDSVKCFHVQAFAIQSSNLELLLCEELSVEGLSVRN